MDEFSLIAKYFAPLARDFSGSLNLTDDAALLDIPAGDQLVITKDAIVEGVHFLGSEPASLIAKKLLRTNLSDLAAMGAKPLAYALAIMLPKDISHTNESSIDDVTLSSRWRGNAALGSTSDTDSKANRYEAWIADFASGLREDQKEFGIHLLGGDTVSTLGKKHFSLTAFGVVPKGKALLRSGAKIGDAIFVSGVLGGGALGLRSDNEYLKLRYFLPQPRLALGQALRVVANACMDISDGFLQDLSHICRASNVGAIVHQHQIPISPLVPKEQALKAALSGGDDYELLFTVSREKIPDVERISRELSLKLTLIGEMTAEENVVLKDENGSPQMPEIKGYRHFS
jgi:thiamine-monophosphate kinase